MRTGHGAVTPGSLRRASMFLVLLNVCGAVIPAAGAPDHARLDWIGASQESAPDPGGAVNSPQASDPPGAGLAGQPPAVPAPFRSPVPMALGTAQNWTPYAPSAFTHGSVSLGSNLDSVNIGTLPNVTLNQTANLTITFNGSWNPVPATAAARDWVLLFIAKNGQLQIATLENNASMFFALGAAQLPFECYFALPSSVGFASASSSARVSALVAPSNTTLFNLTAANAGLNLSAAKLVPAVPADNVWFNGSGSYSGSGPLAGPLSVAVAVPADSTQPFEIRAGQPKAWAEPELFPGARVFLLKGTTGPIAVATFTITVWTRGSPESGLWMNETVSPTEVFRGSDLNVTGVAGNRTLIQSVNWTVNTTAVMGLNGRNSESCTNVVRLQNGSYRMFCSFADTPVLTTVYGVDSAISSDGSNWAWEAGTRFDLCGGDHVINQLAIVRLLDGTLRMYFGGSWGLLSPCGALGSPTHTSSATSGDQGVTWTLESETLTSFGVTSPDVRAVVPTSGGSLRMYLDSGSGIATALSDDGFTWASESVIGGVQPRSVYLLTDGTYKMYYGTTSISSRVSVDGLAWGGTRTEVAAWAGNIEAGPLLDRGDGRLTMLIFSQANGLFLARLNWSFGNPASVTLSGNLSDARAFGATTLTASSNGSLAANMTIPAASPLGRYWVRGNAWFGGTTAHGVVLNRLPVWTGPATLNATEDIPMVVDLANWTLDADTADVVNYSAATAFGILNGSNLSLNYTYPFTSDTIFGNLTDGYDRTPFVIAVVITQVNDAPTIAVNATYTIWEDNATAIDFAGTYLDEETLALLLNLSTDDARAVAVGSVITFTFPLDGSYSVTITVSDGGRAANATTTIQVLFVDDYPIINLPPLYTGNEDAPIALDFAPNISDEETPDALLNLTTNLSQFGASVNGLTLSVLFAQGGLFPFNISVYDGNHSVPATSLLLVTAFNDPPNLTMAADYYVDEDTLFSLNLSANITDEETPTNLLWFNTSLPGAIVSNFTISLLPTVGGDIPFNVTVDDGVNRTVRSAVLHVREVNDAPRWIGIPPIPDQVEDVPWQVKLSLFADDEDNATGDLVFTEDSPYALVNGGGFLVLNFPDGILNATLLLTVSDGLLSDTISVAFNITPVNDPPRLDGTPPNSSNESETLLFQFGATDEDNTSGFVFNLTTNVSWISISPSGLLNITPPAGAHGRVEYAVTVTDAGGAASTRLFPYYLKANHLPVMSPDFTQLPADAQPGHEFSVRFLVTDEDNDNVTLALLQVDPRQVVTLSPRNSTEWQFTWEPRYTYTPGIAFLAWFNGTLWLDDSFGSVPYNFSIRVMDPPDKPPRIDPRIPDQIVNTSTHVIIQLDNYSFDEDAADTDAALRWTIVSNAADVGTWTYDGYTRTFEFTVLNATEGGGTVTFTLSDPSRLSVSQDVIFRGLNATAPGTTPGPNGTTPNAGGELFPWWLLLLILAGGLGAALAYQRFRSAPLEPSASAPAAGPGSAPSAQVVAATSHNSFLVEDVFLLYKDGRTIFTRGGLGADAIEDPETVGAMLIAVQDFVRDSFHKGSPVDRMGYGDSVILIEKGDHVLLAVTVYGEPTREFRELLTEVVRNFQATYAGLVEDWSGSRSDFVGVEAILAPIWSLTADLTRADVLLATTKAEVQMLSGVEFFQGFVRVKVGIVNNTPSVISGVTVDLDYNADVLRLGKIEPASYKSAGAKVNLGVIHTSEKVTIAFYLDPQICTSSAIDGACRYKDSDGAEHTVKMKTRRAEVVCPLFFTKEQANTAMLRRLVETELRQFDVRAYQYSGRAKDADLRRLFDSLKSAVLSHDVQMVRSFEKRQPYLGEAWFYGKTQVKGYQMVMRAVVDDQRKRAEFFVASNVMRSITGLLAELHHTFNEQLHGRLNDLEIKPLFEEDARSAYSDVTAVSKMIEGEAEAGESEQAPVEGTTGDLAKNGGEK